jgi:hypothetical protein
MKVWILTAELSFGAGEITSVYASSETGFREGAEFIRESEGSFDGWAWKDDDEDDPGYLYVATPPKGHEPQWHVTLEAFEVIE